MEYLNGLSLNQLACEHGPMSEPKLRRLAYGLARALTDIHELGIVHRDLKPLNVMLSGDKPRPIDFGLAKVTQESTLTQLTPVEQILGPGLHTARAGHEGCISYEAFTRPLGLLRIP